MTNDESRLPENSTLSTKELKQLKKELKNNKQQLVVLTGAREYLGQKLEAQLADELEADILKLRQQIEEAEKRLEVVSLVSVDPKVYEVIHPQPSLTYSIDELVDIEATFIPVEEAGRVEVYYTGGIVDLYQLSFININLQLIVDNVAFNLLQQAGMTSILPHRGERTNYPHIIRTEIVEAKIGSFQEVLTFAVNLLLNQPDVRSILQNLAANVIWSIGASGVGKIIEKNTTNKELAEIEKGPFDVGQNTHNMFVAFAQSPSPQGAELKLIHYGANNEKTEVSLRIPASEDSSKPSISETSSRPSLSSTKRKQLKKPPIQVIAQK